MAVFHDTKVGTRVVPVLTKPISTVPMSSKAMNVDRANFTVGRSAASVMVPTAAPWVELAASVRPVAVTAPSVTVK